MAPDLIAKAFSAGMFAGFTLGIALCAVFAYLRGRA